MSDPDPQQLADELEREAEAMERHSQELRERTEGVQQDWERKRSDPGVPGAPGAETDGPE
jgi:hypothetical protein